MNPQEARERAEQEAADQAEERRVARQAPVEEARIAEEAAKRLAWRANPLVPPYLFADERSQHRIEEAACHERPLDDYAAWTDQNEQLFR